MKGQRMKLQNKYDENIKRRPFMSMIPAGLAQIISGKDNQRYKGKMGYKIFMSS